MFGYRQYLESHLLNFESKPKGASIHFLWVSY